MKIKILTYISFICATCSLGFALNNVPLTKLLEEKIKWVNHETEARIIRDTEKHAEFSNFRSIALPKNYINAHWFTLFNTTYALVDFELYYILPAEDKFKLNELQSFTDYENEVHSVETVEYNGHGFLLISLKNGVTNVYYHLNNTRENVLVQSIESKNVQDAKFFIQKKKLYLIISSVQETALMPMILYEWKNSHFDEIDQTLTRGASGLLTFSSGDSEIIILLQNSSISDKPRSVIYEFSYGHLKKSQIFKTNHPKDILTWIFDNRRYVLILDELYNDTLYWWDGSEIVEIAKFNSIKNIEKTLLMYIESAPVLFVLNKTRLLAYTPTQDQLTLLSEIKFDVPFEKVSDLGVTRHNETNNVLILGRTGEAPFIYSIVNFSFELTEKEPKAVKEDPLSECYSNLEEQLKSLETKLNLLESKSNKILQTNQPAEIDGRMNVAAPIVAQSAFIYQPTEIASQIERRIEEANLKLKNVETKMENLFGICKVEANIKGKTIIKGTLHAFQLTVKNLNLTELNSITWTPEKWWSRTKAQIIEGAVRIKNMSAKNLQVTARGTVFEGLLQQNGSVTVGGSWTIKSLTAPKLFTSKINEVELNNLYLRSNATVLKGLKQFKNLEVNNARITYLNKRNASDVIKLFADPKSQSYQFAPNLYVTNLHADFINGVDWQKFAASVFQVGKSNLIEGSISMNRPKINRLYVSDLNHLNVKDFLTTSTDQVITSNINFRNIVANDINCSEINGATISAETVATTDGDSNFIKGPVFIYNFYATNLNLKGKEINGPDQSDLLQIYSNQVTIIGTLHLENVTLPNGAQMFISGKDFNVENLNNYWLKSAPQEIPVHVEMQRGLTAPQLSTNFLNGIKLDDYMLDNLGDTPPTKFYFENATVTGDLTINENNTHTPNLKEIDRTAVRLNGEFEIKGQKFINGELKVDNLSVRYLENVDVKDVVTVRDENISSSMIFERVVVKGDLTVSKAKVNELNDIDLSEVYDKFVLINHNASFDHVLFENVTVENLHARKINGKLFSEYVLTCDKIYDLDTVHTLQIIGNVKVDGIRNTSYFNGIKTEVLTENVGKQVVIKGGAKFLNTVRAKNLRMLYLNDVNLEKLTGKLFYHSYPQLITGRHSFKIVRSPDLYAPQINEFNLDNLIDVGSYEPQVLVLMNTLHFTSVEFLKSLNANDLPCDIKQAVANLQSPPTRYWSTVHILGDVDVMDKNELSHFLEKAVTTDKMNVVTAPVTFTQIAAKSLTSSKNINNVNISKIYEDALLKHENDQLVTGAKQFKRITAAGASVSGNIGIPVINKLLIAKLNESIIRKGDVNNVRIRGRKTLLGGLKTRILNTPSILGLDPEDLVSTQNRRIIPYATFEHLHVLNNFDVNFVNNVNFTAFISNRLMKNCPDVQYVDGTYYFDNVDINSDSIIPEINRIRLDDVVFDDDDVQEIPSPKTFVQNVEIFGNAEVDLLNGINVTSAYEQAILYNEEAVLEGNVVFNEITEVSGDITAENINGVPVDLIKELLTTQTPEIKANITQDTIQEIVNSIEQNIDAVKRLPSEYMYLEKADALQISLPNTMGAYVIESKDRVMLHVIGEKPGYTCGLPVKCNCPTQHTVEITTEGSIQIFPSTDVQRVYSYENDDITIHVATNSISSTEFCRSNSSDLLENGTLVWLVKSGNNSGKHFIYPEYITGFIRGVEFFAADGYTYAVIGRFYDAFMNSHDLDCLVFQFTKNMDDVQLIQTISTRGLWTLHVFHTAQGTHLIIGNIFNPDFNKIGSGTDLYRFDPTKQQFFLVRNIPGPGCTSVSVVVLQTDSFIVLAQRKSPLLVLKYDRHYDNYYFYENFVLDSHVVQVSIFYVAGSDVNDAYLCAVTENNHFYVYAYQYILGWKLKSHGEIEGLRSLTPFILKGDIYLFAASSEISFVLSVVKNG